MARLLSQIYFYTSVSEIRGTSVFTGKGSALVYLLWRQCPSISTILKGQCDDVTYVYDDVTYVYDDVTYVYEVLYWKGSAMMREA